MTHEHSWKTERPCEGQLRVTCTACDLEVWLSPNGDAKTIAIDPGNGKPSRFVRVPACKRGA